MSFSHGGAETQEEQGQLPRHPGHEESRWLKRGKVIQDCQDPGSDGGSCLFTLPFIV